MSKNQSIPKPFKELTKSAWIELAKKQLKDQKYEDIIWRINDRISIEPYYTLEECSRYPPISTIPPSWKIGSVIQVSDEKESNIIILDALKNGVQDLLIRIEEPFNPDLLLNEVYPEMVGLHFDFPSKQTPSFGEEQWLKNVAAKIESGSIRNCYEKSIPHAKIILDLPETTPSLVDVSLSNLIKEMVLHCETQKTSPANSLILTVGIGHNHLVEIAKLRALRILTAHVFNEFGWDPEIQPEIECHVRPDKHESDVNTNLILATLKTLSAATGGADRIFVHPANGDYQSSFGNRMARNIQHILQLESHLAKVADPAAGSYYVEKLTDALADSAWELFSK